MTTNVNSTLFTSQARNLATDIRTAHDAIYEGQGEIMNLAKLHNATVSFMNAYPSMERDNNEVYRAMKATANRCHELDGRTFDRTNAYVDQRVIELRRFYWTIEDECDVREIVNNMRAIADHAGANSDQYIANRKDTIMLIENLIRRRVVYNADLITALFESIELLTHPRNSNASQAAICTQLADTISGLAGSLHSD